MDFLHPSMTKTSHDLGSIHHVRWSGQENQHSTILAWIIIVLSLLLTKLTLPCFMLFLLLYFLKHATDGFPPQLNLLEMHGRSPCPSALPTLWLLLNLRPIASMPHCVTLSTWFLAVHYISQPFQRFVGDGGVLYSLSAISLSKRFILGIFLRGQI